MKTCVLCLRRRNAFECTMRSRSRWNGVRSGESGSGTARRAGYERAASGESERSSNAAMRSWKLSSTAVAIEAIVSPRPAAGSAGVRYRRLRRGHARDRDAVRRAAHVVEPGPVEEVDRLGVAAVLAADPELEVGLGLPAGPRREPDEPADAGLVDRLERAAVHDLALDVPIEELALDVVAREPERGLREVVRSEREEVRHARDAGASARAPARTRRAES